MRQEENLSHAVCASEVKLRSRKWETLTTFKRQKREDFVRLLLGWM